MQQLDVFLTPLQYQRLKKECPIFRDGKQEEINKILKALLRREIVLTYVDAGNTDLVEVELNLSWKTEFKLWGSQIKVGQIECEDKLLERYGELEKQFTGITYHGATLAAIVATKLTKLMAKDYTNYGIRVTKAGKVRWETDILESLDSCVQDIIVNGFEAIDEYERNEFIEDELQRLYWSVDDFMYLNESSNKPTEEEFSAEQKDYEEFLSYVAKAYEGIDVDLSTNIMVVKHILRKVEELACSDGMRKDYSNFYKFVTEQKRKDLISEE